ncbi:glycosyltransferase family 4 protein [Rosistilla oblonga]|uniref:Alpha-D-kanosaminyltransferase n=1 Tax=Rosistilla oblonga TaxID=2527990 RepID=A0A518J1W2_9BACT|nr:glycosyltransferase family 4 protein [Rosistilla oblonga]QDV59327.1 Alpha-D-kanosaminyltransferase [Rosistilla oblonga]
MKVFFASTIGAAPYEDPNFKQQVQWSNLKLDEFEHVFLNNEPLSSSKTLDAPHIVEELDSFGADVVIVYGYWQRFQQRVHRWTRDHKALLYYISDSEIHRQESKLKRFLKSLRSKRVFRNVDRFLTVGNANEFYYHSLGVPTERMTRMQFSIDVQEFDVAYECRHELRQETRNRLGVSNDCTVLSVAGKLVSWKRQRDAIEAIARIDRTRDVLLVLMGSGPDELELRDLVNQICPDRVHFAGFVPPTDLPNYYLATDIYLHCSNYEPHSLAISEAIYLGLPLILSSRCGSYGPLDDLQPGKNGFVYPVGDVTALAKSVERMIENVELRELFAAESRAYAGNAQERAHQSFLTQALRADGLIG